MLTATKAEILELYTEQQLSADEIAAIVGIEQAFVDNVIADYEAKLAWENVTV